MEVSFWIVLADYERRFIASNSRLMFDVTNLRFFLVDEINRIIYANDSTWILNSDPSPTSLYIFESTINWVEKCLIIYKLVRKLTLFLRRFYAMNFEVNYRRNIVRGKERKAECVHVIFVVLSIPKAQHNLFESNSSWAFSLYAVRAVKRFITVQQSLKLSTQKSLKWNAKKGNQTKNRIKNLLRRSLFDVKI